MRPVSQFSLCAMPFVVALFSCSMSEFAASPKSSKGAVQSVSASYNHFEGGVLFSDVERGLDVLWEASFDGKRIFRENLGMFINGGLLILPNRKNTRSSAVISSLPTIVKDNKLFVLYNGEYTAVFGIIHTHPDSYHVREPAPRYDYQYCSLGLHSYVMGCYDLLDAMKAPDGEERFARLGPRKSYDKIPWRQYCFPLLDLPSAPALADSEMSDLQPTVKEIPHDRDKFSIK
jgi:hypothetical protein